MGKTHWLSWILLCLVMSVVCLRGLDATQVNANQVLPQGQRSLPPINLLLQDDNEKQAVVVQNIQMITALLLSDEDVTQTQFQLFLPQVALGK